MKVEHVVRCPRCDAPMQQVGLDKKRRFWFKCESHGHYTVNVDELRKEVIRRREWLSLQGRKP